MKNILLVVEYEGTNFSGWQKQIGERTVEEELKKSLDKATGEDIKIIASGRTDRHVHAKGQVVNFKTQKNIPGENYKKLMDFLLPNDISISNSYEVDLSFHSRFDAIKRKYKYLIYRRELPNALVRNWAYHFPYRLKVSDMKEASKALIGTHNFKAFKASGENDDKINMIRTIYDIDIIENGDFLEVIIEGNSFLHNMVRIIVGTLVYIGTGKIEKKEIENILKSKNRKLAGITVGAQGLYLERVYYNKNYIRDKIY